MFTEKEQEGLQEIRRLRNEFLAENNEESGSRVSDKVRQFLSGASDDLLVQYLRGRKYRPQFAWDTLKRNAEVRFDRHPHLFPQTLPDHVAALRSQNQVSVLKQPNALGQRIIVLNSTEWDPKVCLEDVGMSLVTIVDELVKDENCMKNGVIFVVQVTGLGLSHARIYAPSVVKRLINVFVHSYPLKIKGIYYLNAHYVVSCVIALLRPFLPKKIGERLIITADGDGYRNLHNVISPEILPTFLGGTLEPAEAF